MHFTIHRHPVFLPILAILMAMCSIQLGAALAKGLFPLLGPVGATTLRLVLAALILTIAFRPWRGASMAGHRGAVLGYGAALGLMNLFYYLALERVPLGITVAVEFLGPLTVAIVHSHRRIDFAWVLLAVIGLALLLPLPSSTAHLDLLGLGFAALAGFFWAMYIVFGTRAGLGHGSRSVALGMVVGALIVMPFGAAKTGIVFSNPSILPLGIAVAVLSSALPYVLEMKAMTRMPTRVFGIFMSVEPAIAALFGYAMLDERLTILQCLAIGCVMFASLGSALTGKDSDETDVPH
jgi:inner membrane transporter RhtA